MKRFFVASLILAVAVGGGEANTKNNAKRSNQISGGGPEKVIGASISVGQGYNDMTAGGQEGHGFGGGQLNNIQLQGGFKPIYTNDFSFDGGQGANQELQSYGGMSEAKQLQSIGSQGGDDFSQYFGQGQELQSSAELSQSYNYGTGTQELQTAGGEGIQGFQTAGGQEIQGFQTAGGQGLQGFQINGGQGGATGGVGRGATVSTITQRVPVPVPQPYPVPVSRPIPVPIPQPVPVPVPRPVQIRVPVPNPVAVPRPVPVTVTRRVPYPVQVPIRVPFPQPVQVPVPQPVPVTIPQPVPVPVRQNIVVPVPQPVSLGSGGQGASIGNGLENGGYGSVGSGYESNSNQGSITLQPVSSSPSGAYTGSSGGAYTGSTGGAYTGSTGGAYTGNVGSATGHGSLSLGSLGSGDISSSYSNLFDSYKFGGSGAGFPDFSSYLSNSFNLGTDGFGGDSKFSSSLGSGGQSTQLAALSSDLKNIQGKYINLSGTVSGGYKY